MSDYDPNDDGVRKDPWTGEEFEVVWSGGPLLGPRDSRTTDPDWTPPKRLYNKQRKEEAATVVEVDESISDEVDQRFVVVTSEE